MSNEIDVTPLRGADVVIYATSGSPQALNNEAMQEKDDTWLFNQRYTVYQITAKAHRNLAKGTVPAFQKQVHGTGDWVDISASDIKEIQYPGGRLILKVPLNSNDVVRCHTGNYLVPSQIMGAYSCKLDNKRPTKQFMPYGESSIRKFPSLREWTATIENYLVRLKASATTAIAGNDNDLTLTHGLGGTPGNGISLTYIDPAANSQELSVTVATKAITVHLATDEHGTITSTCNDVVEALNTSLAVHALGVTAQPTGTGKGLVAAMSAVTTSGGAEPADLIALTATSPCIVLIYILAGTDMRWEGYGFVSGLNKDMPSDDIVKDPITIDGDGENYFRLS